MKNLIPLVERRKHRRFIVSGTVEFARKSEKGSADLVNLGEGGMLIRNGVTFPEGTEVSFHVAPVHCPVELDIRGQVVGVNEGLMAVRFLEQRQEVSFCVQWLARENCPWAGTIENPGLKITRYPVSLTEPKAPRIPEVERAQELVFQQA
jgi:hypothetical protein